MKKIKICPEAIIVVIEGKRVSIPFSEGYVSAYSDECECCGTSQYVAFEFEYKKRRYEVVLKDS